MPKAAAGRGEKTTAANAVIPKITPIVRMTLAAYEALKVGHLEDQNNHQRALRAIGSYGRGRNAAWLKLAEQAIKNSETVLVYETPLPR
jgi:hypothetical protein